MKDFSRLLAKLPTILRKQYSLGTIDCLRLLFFFYPELPREYKGITFANYTDFFIENKEEALKTLDSFIEEQFIEATSVKTGDLLRFSFGYGFYCGTNKVIIVDDKRGVVSTEVVWNIEKIFRRV